MILFSTRMSSSGRPRPWSAWVYAENKPLQVLGVPLLPPQCGNWARRHHAEMVFMNELWFAVVPPPSAPTSFLMLLPKASTFLIQQEARQPQPQPATRPHRFLAANGHRALGTGATARRHIDPCPLLLGPGLG